MSDSTQVVMPSVFPDDHPQFAGIPTNLKITELQAHGKSMGDWPPYKVAVHRLFEATLEAAKTPDEVAAEKRTKQIGLAAGAGVLTTIAGFAAAYKLNRFHANPAVYERATIRQALNALAGIDDDNTDLVSEDHAGADAAVWIIDDVGGVSGGRPILKIIFTQLGDDLKVEVHSVEEAHNASTDSATGAASWMDSDLVKALKGADMQGMQTAVMTGAGKFKDQATSLLDLEKLKTVGPAVVFYDQIWDKLDAAFGDPTETDMITKVLKKLG